MTTRELIIVKLLGLASTIAYGQSGLWISMMFLYGGLYVPLRELGLRESIYFETFVIIFSLITIAVILFKLKGQSFWKILFQDIGLIIILIPFFGTIFGFFGNGLDSDNNFYLVYGAILFLTLLIINLNDWIKTKKASR